MTARKKWQTRYVGKPKRHTSQTAAYRYVDQLRGEYEAGMLPSERDQVAVWVMEGNDEWSLYERCDLRVPAAGGAR